MCTNARAAWRVVRPAALLIALACLLVASTGVTADDDAAAPVYLLNAVYSVDGFTAPHADAIWAGIDAALYASNYTAAGGRPINIVQPDFTVNKKANIVDVVQHALNKYPSLLGVIGPYSDMRLAALLADATLQQENVTFVGPFTGSGTVRKWNNAVYFTRAEPRAELLVMVHYIVNTLRARRIAFMYLTGVEYGDSEYASLVSAVANLARDPPALYAVPYSYSASTVEEAAFDAMADTYPQVIIVWGMPGHQVVAFMEAVLTDPRTSSACIMTSFALQPMLTATYRSMLLSGLPPVPNGKLLSSATAFPPTDQEPDHMQLFRDEVSTYLTESTAGQAAVAAAGVSTAAEYLAAQPDAAQLMVAGWLSGKLIQQTLEQSKWIEDRNTYRAGLFQQNRYIIGGDYVLGDYGGDCNAFAAATGAVCECNQGGHEVLLTAFVNDTWQRLAGAGFAYSQGLCYVSDVALPKPLNNLILRFTDYPQLLQRAEEFAAVAPAVLSAFATAEDSFNFAGLVASSEDAQAALSSELSNYSVDIIFAAMVTDIDVGDVFVSDVVFPKPLPVVAKRNYIYTMPVLEQEIYLLYMHLDRITELSSISTRTNVILRNYTNAELDVVKELLFKSAATFNVPNPSTTTIAFRAAISRLLVPDSVNMIVGLYDGDAAVIASFLTSEPRAVVVLCFDDLTVFYDDLVAAFITLPASVQARLVSFSSLPLWSDTSAAAHAASPLLTAFHQLMPTATKHVPSALRDFTTAAFVELLLRYTSFVNSDALLDTIYRNSVVSVYAMSFGPFVWSCSNSSVGESCLYKNFGAQSIAMLSMQRMLDPSVPQLTARTTPSLVYKPRTAPAGSLTDGQKRGIIAGSVIGGVLLIAALALLVCWCSGRGRNNDDAPKDGEEPLTLIFTDIESSTAMWAALPQLMADAIASHHRVIRQLIKERGCYEVKTVGDSFMIACKDAHSAVQLACDIQTRLLKYDWGTTEIDSKYREFERAKVKSVDDYEPPTARLSEEVYDSMWRGLRVRIGLHTGLSDIRYDEVTKGYDYYGDTSNMAARTEAIANGGQVVATESTWWALSDPERDALNETMMGPQGLRGVPFAVGMHQLNAVPGRTHAALRTEIEAIVPDKDAAEIASSGAGVLSSDDARAGPAANVATVITSCFAPHPPAQRVWELQPLLTKWSVTAPPRNRDMDEEDYCQSLINRLAIRIATVAQAKQRLEEDAVACVPEAMLSPRGASNPLLGDAAAVSSIYVKRPPRSEAPPTQAARSPLHESPSSCISAPAAFPPLAPHRFASRSRSPVDGRGTVEPFRSLANRPHSLDSSMRVGGPGSSAEAVVVPMPKDIRLRHRRTNSEASELALSEV